MERGPPKPGLGVEAGISRGEEGLIKKLLRKHGRSTVTEGDTSEAGVTGGGVGERKTCSEQAQDAPFGCQKQTTM